MKGKENNVNENDIPFPHAEKLKSSFQFEDGEPNVSEDEDRPEAYDNVQWRKENREPWQLPSAESSDTRPQVVNPTSHKWETSLSFFKEFAPEAFWEKVQSSSSTYSDDSLTVESLNDDHQQFFVQLILDHARQLIEASLTKKKPKPLRLLLLGTAGTGKTRAIQTLLQELQNILEKAKLPTTFVRVAAPTGSAAFNIRFSASTIHRLIHWFTPPYFQALKENSDALLKLQEFFRSTQLILIDEVSMVGRQMMGRIDSRLRQATADRENCDDDLGGLSAVCVGDPAQCEAIMDQQLYDTDPHKRTAEVEENSCAKLSNAGLNVYSNFDEVIILTHVHRLHTLDKEDLSKEEKEYNERARRFIRIMHRLRDLEWTLEDYYWLCRRKLSMLSLTERRRFHNAPVIMDYRRETKNNPENNATHYNRMKLRRHALKVKMPVARFEAHHEGIEHDAGLKLDDGDFRNLPNILELAEEAPVIVVLNLAIEHGIMNGTRGTVKEILYTKPDGPLSTRLTDRMPHTVLVDCPKYSGPSFFDTSEYPDRKTWIPFRPKTRHSEKDASISRTQLPFVLAWGITTEKAQGMTLDIGVVAIGKKAASPGIAFTALTRFRHPDDVALDDSFPDVSTIMRQRETKSFQKRLNFEKRMRIIFSRTLRRRFRDKTLYDPAMVWDEAESNLAEDIFKYVHAHDECDEAMILKALRETNPQINEDTFKNVWERLQKWPHSCELEAARKHVPTLEKKNSTDDGPLPKLPLCKMSAQGYYVYIDEWRNFKDHGLLTLSAFEFIAKIFRRHLPNNVVLYAPGILTTAKPTLTKAQMLRAPRFHRGEIKTRVYPYLSRSKHWALFFLHDFQHDPNDHNKITALLPRDVAPEAFDWICSHITRELNAVCSTQTFDEISNADVMLFAQIASFLQIAVTDTETLDSTHSLLAKSCQFAETMLHAAVNETTDGNLDSLFPKDAKLKNVYDSLFVSVLPRQKVHDKPGTDLFNLFGKRKRPSASSGMTPETKDSEVAMDEGDAPQLKQKRSSAMSEAAEEKKKKTK